MSNGNRETFFGTPHGKHLSLVNKDIRTISGGGGRAVAILTCSTTRTTAWSVIGSTAIVITMAVAFLFNS